jgi:hypothetical protein
MFFQVQDIVVGNKNFTDVTKPSEIVQLLLNDDQLANLDSSNTSGSSSKKTGKQVVGVSEGSSGDTMRAIIMLSLHRLRAWKRRREQRRQPRERSGKLVRHVRENRPGRGVERRILERGM